MRTVKPSAALRALAVAAALFPAACVSSGAAKEPDRRESRSDEIEIAKKGPGAVDYAMVVPENVVYLPWKPVGGALKGASDGVMAGFDKGRMPLLGLLFSPVNLAVGFVTGVFEGAAGSPGVVGPSDDFGRAMSAPTKHTTSIWWYP